MNAARALLGRGPSKSSSRTLYMKRYHRSVKASDPVSSAFRGDGDDANAADEY